jgi:hypothetical protein
VSTFHWKAVVHHSTTMSWDILVRVLDEQTLHSRRSKMVQSSSSSSSDMKSDQIQPSFPSRGSQLGIFLKYTGPSKLSSKTKFR